MNRAVLFFVLILFGSYTQAQVTDTLGFADFQLGVPTVYQSPNGGYAFGNNGYGDKAKAQSYYNENSFVLREVLLQFGHASFGSGDSSSVVRVNVYDNNGPGVTSYGASDSIAPDSVLAHVDIPVYQLLDDGSYAHAVLSDDTVAIFSRFSVGIDLSFLMPGDTVGLVSTTDGDAGGSLNAWELASNNTWFTVEEPTFSWGLDVDMAIFPVIDENDPAGVHEASGTEWSLFPNPTNLSVRILMPYGAQWKLSVYDMTGRLLTEQIFTGASYQIDVADIGVGVFCVTLSDGRVRSTKMLVTN